MVDVMLTLDYICILLYAIRYLYFSHKYYDKKVIELAKCAYLQSSIMHQVRTFGQGHGLIVEYMDHIIIKINVVEYCLPVLRNFQIPN